jgi:hypothetical protein
LLALGDCSVDHLPTLTGVLGCARGVLTGLLGLIAEKDIIVLYDFVVFII